MCIHEWYQPCTQAPPRPRFSTWGGAWVRGQNVATIMLITNTKITLMKRLALFPAHANCKQQKARQGLGMRLYIKGRVCDVGTTTLLYIAKKKQKKKTKN